MTKRIIVFFDKLEDKIRQNLSRYPLAYAIIGGISTILFWRGVWQTADQIPLLSGNAGHPFSVLLSLMLLLGTGLFVASFIGDYILISGVKREKKLAEKTETEVREEENEIAQIQKDIREIKEMISGLKK